jgi:hypothetical protein
VNHTGSLLATWVIVSVNIMIKFPRGKDEFEIERHVAAGRKYSLLPPREYLVPSRSEETQLNTGLFTRGVFLNFFLPQSIIHIATIS